LGKKASEAGGFKKKESAEAEKIDCLGSGTKSRTEDTRWRVSKGSVSARKGRTKPKTNTPLQSAKGQTRQGGTTA